MDCKRTLQELIVDWKETPMLNEEKMTRIIRESWMKEKNVLPIKVKLDFTTTSTTVRDTCLEVKNVMNDENIDVMTVNNIRDNCTSDSDNRGKAKKGKEPETDFEEDSEVKNRSSCTQRSDSTSQTKPLRTAKTTKGSPVRQLKLKKAIEIIPARVSRQIDEKIYHQTSTDVQKYGNQ